MADETILQVFSDYVCPYCLLFEDCLAKAVAGRNITVEWKPFELRPYPTPTLEPEGDYLQRVWRTSVYPMAEEMGIQIKLPKISPQPHTRLAFEGFQFAKEAGKGNAYNHSVLSAFFQQGLDIGDPAVLTKIAVEVGLPGEGYRSALESGRYSQAHLDELADAAKLRISSVPTLVVAGNLYPGVMSADRLALIFDQVGFTQQ